MSPYSFAVSGISCQSPTAPALDFAVGENPLSTTASAVHAPSMHSVFETLDALLVCVIVDAFAGRAPNVRGVPATNALTSTHAVATTVLPRLSIPPLSAPCHTLVPWPKKQRK